jgi:transcriptional regulator with XRE-family HTH domain
MIEQPRMIEQHAPPGVADVSAGSPGSTGTSFNRWLEVQLKARRLTQRQLAHKSGVNHSTISRLMRGGRIPSLRTAALLARGLGLADGLDWLEPRGYDATALAPARVEHALRLDQVLSDAQVRDVMQVYLTARLGRRRSMPVRRPAETTTTPSVADWVPVSAGLVRAR